MKNIGKLLIALSLILLVLFVGCTKEGGGDKEPIPTEEVQPTAMPRENRPYYNEIQMNRKKRISLYDPKDTDYRLAMQTLPGSELALQFYAVTDFRGLRFSCPSYSNNKGTIRFTIYEWDISYQRTIKGKALASKEYKDFRDNSWLDFFFDPLPEGEYLVLIEGVEEDVGVWAYTTPFFGTRLYQRGIEIKGSIEAELDYMHSTDVTTAVLSPNVWWLEGSSEVPDELVLDKDHPINKLNVRPDLWTATDGLGRTMPTYKDVGDKKDKYVGMFYWTWHKATPTTLVPRDITKIMKQYPEAQNDYNHKVWYEVENPIYYWEEPIYGYYLATDKYVLRKHAELLADAGVDVVFFDTTNGTYLWIEQYEALCEAWIEAMEDGVRAPKISFLMNFHGGDANRRNTVTQLEVLYQLMFRPGKYRELWFYWEGKPLLMARYEDLDPENRLHKEILDFFTFRPGDPSYYTKEPAAQDVWGWLSVYPQTKFGVDKDGNIEQICVGVSQNANDNGLTAMNGVGVYGRAYTKGDYSYTYTYMGKEIVVDKNIPNTKLYGLNFQQQWDYAHDNDPKFVWITGWNERTVGRYEEWGGVTNAFPDQFNDEFSRDIEPTTGDLKDHYYYQLVANVRKFKGLEKPVKVNARKTIVLGKGIKQWDDVLPEYNHYKESTKERNINGVNYDIVYENYTMRNDIIQSKLAYDDDNVYFMVKTVDKLTPHTDPAWMRLFIDTEESEQSWESFEYVVNRLNPTDKVAYLERSTGGWNWELVGEVEYEVVDNVLQLKIPRKMIGQDGKDSPELNFKWSDNMQADGDIMDFYLNGDVAPGGRFKFMFSEKLFEGTSKRPSSMAAVIGIIASLAVAAIAAIAGVFVINRKRNKKA